MLVHPLIMGLALAWIAILAGGWLGWQLLRQNGRLLLRLEELAKRLESLEFGEPAPSAGLPIGSPAPEFDLPDLAGRTRTRTEFRGQSVLLIFFHPACGFCRDMTPKLAALFAGCSRREEAQTENGEPESKIDQSVTSAATNGENSGSELVVVIVSTGSEETNRQLFDEHKVTIPVLLQKEMEVAAAYQANGTPSGYLIDAEGKIVSGLAVGAEALLEIAKESRSTVQEGNDTSVTQASVSNGRSEDQSLVASAATNRFKERSLARSKIKLDGLKAGTPAPDFRLPRLDGRGELGLSEFRGRRVLLVFSSPGCDPCNALASELEKFHRAQTERDWSPVAAGRNARDAGELYQPHQVVAAAVGDRPRSGKISVVMISKGEPKENRAKAKEHRLTFPIVLQQQWEISRRYAMFATPIAYLIDEQGIIVRDVAVGTEAIQKVISNYYPDSRVTDDLEITNRHSLVTEAPE